MGWVWLVLAGVCEMTGVVMINEWHKRRNVLAAAGLAAGFGLSFLFLALAMQTLPMATAYAVWTGIGASGGAVLGIILYKESADRWRILFIALILASAVGLKFLS
jgi:paired small multidrug resistance pump